MKVTIDHIAIRTELMQVPDLNFGQFKRWESHQPKTYRLEVDIVNFRKRVNVFLMSLGALKLKITTLWGLQN